jgi:arsenical pump membrane protein
VETEIDLDGQLRESAALLVALLTLLGVLFRPRKIAEGAFAAAGAAVLFALQIITWADVQHVFSANLTVLAFFLGMMSVTALAEEAQVFERLAFQTARWSSGSPRRLYLFVFLLGSLISTFLTNDATALILTPVVYTLVTRLRLDPLPFVFACTFIADTASMTLQISNPINLILAQHFAELTLRGFLQYLFLPSLTAITINILGFAFIFRRRLRGRFAPAQANPQPADPGDDRAFRVSVAILICIGVAFVVASELRPSPIGLVAMAGAVVMASAAVVQRRLNWAALRQGVSWSIFPFILGMFLVVQGLEHVGATAQLGGLLARLAGLGFLPPAVVATLFSAVSSNLINNVPTVAVMTAAIPTVHHLSQNALVYGTLIGCDLGPNLTVVGSLSTMLWLLLLRQRNLEVSALDYARFGVVITPVMLLAASGLLALLLR